MPSNSTRCPGCQADLPSTLGPTHEYMLSSSACWSLYGEILAHDYSDPRFMRLHRLTVDAYAAQHPGRNVPTARRSIAVHLSRLYLLLERQWPMESANEAAAIINELKIQAPWLPPPAMTGTLTIKDVAGAPTLEEHESSVRSWAESVWQAWRPHHQTVRTWCARL